MNLPTGPARPRSQHGFSLVEILVAVAIALIGVVVIFQVLSLWEERKRTTSSGSDAQVAGTLAMFNLDRDIRLGGMGFGMSTYMGCTVQAYDTARSPAAFTFNLYPVEIVQGASGAADTIRVLYGTSSTVVGNQAFTTSTATSKKTTGRAGFNKGDLVLVAGNVARDCALVEVTDNTNADALTIDHGAVAYVNYLNESVTARYNNPAGTGTTFSAGTLHNFGPGNALSSTVLPPRWNEWAVRTNNTLAWSDKLHSTTTWFEVAEGIVNLQAEYGVDSNADNQISGTEWTTTAPTSTTWSNLRAIRVAILARSQQYEKLAVTNTAPSWQGGSFTMTNLDGTTDSNPSTANNWRHYRYRVYERVIPLRNLIWGTQP